jgi:hypothetical protein
MHRIRILIIFRFGGPYLRCNECGRCRSDQLAEIRLFVLGDLVPPIFSATLKKSLQNGVELSLHLLLQPLGKLFNGLEMVDVSTMREASLVALLACIITVASHADLGLNLVSLRFL